jgi:hypothetical protein
MWLDPKLAIALLFGCDEAFSGSCSQVNRQRCALLLEASGPESEIGSVSAARKSAGAVRRRPPGQGAAAATSAQEPGSVPGGQGLTSAAADCFLHDAPATENFPSRRNL